MPQWVDLRAHGLMLLAQREPEGDGIRALVIRRLRADAEIPIEAVTYGFAQRGGEFVRIGAEFSLSAIRRLFLRSKLVDLPESAITYRRSATVVSLHPERAASADNAPDASISEWARIPLPRFQLEASTAWVDGRLLVMHGTSEFQTQRRTDPAAAKAEAHRDAVTRALARGGDLPCEVLVDYADEAYWGAKHGHAAVRAAQLLSRLGVAEKLLRGESGYLVLTHPSQPALHIERTVVHEGVHLAFTHYQRRKADEPSVRGEVVFAIRNGRLFLAETATINSEGIEIRGFDTHFASAFMQALLTNGYDLARVSWSEESARDRHHLHGRDVQRLLQQHDAAITPIQDGPYAGLYIAAGPDAAGRVQLVLGISAHAAITAFAERVAGGPAGEIRQLGLNLFREVLIEDSAGRRHRVTQQGPVPETDGDQSRSVEFMTVAEGLEVMALGRTTGMPAVGSWLFGRPVSRISEGSDGRPVYFAIETKGSAVLVHYFVLHSASQSWECLGHAWSGAEPTDPELHASYAHACGATFDSDTLLAGLNVAIKESNQGLEDAYQFPELSTEQFNVVHPNATTYLMQFKDPLLPMVVAIEADGDLWRVCTSSSKSYPVPLGSACSAAASKLADARMNYLRRLHRGEDGALRIGLPGSDFKALRTAVRSVAGGDPPASQRTAVHFKAASSLPLKRLTLHETSETAFCLRVQDTDLTYEVFWLEIDPNSTISNFDQEGILSISKLAEQIESDIAWTEKSGPRHDATMLQAWVNRYLDLQIRHYGEEHLARVPTRAARELVFALADRDVDVLLQSVGRDESNSSADKLFEEVSACLLGDSTRSRQDAIYAFCGFDPAAAERHRSGLEAREAQRALAEGIERITRAADAARYTYDGMQMSGREYLDRLIADGFTLLDADAGASATRCCLSNGATADAIVLRGALASYARHVLTAPRDLDPAAAQSASNR